MARQEVRVLGGLIPVKFEILEDGWVTCYTFEKPWTTGEVVAHYAEDIAYRSKMDHPVYSLLDFRLSKQLPPSDIFRARSNVPILVSPTSGEMIFSGASAFEKRIAETVLKIIRYKKVKFFDTNEEAWQYLRLRIAEDKQAVSNAK